MYFVYRVAYLAVEIAIVRLTLGVVILGGALAISVSTGSMECRCLRVHW